MLIAFVIMMYAMFSVMDDYRRKTKKETTAEPKKKKKSKPDQADQVLDTLVWMLERNIITQQEYNQFIVKVSGYL
jgi:large-conductance mechanosensitive channel